MARRLDDASTAKHFDAVVDAVRLGDDKAVAELFTELNPRLVRFLRARSGQAGDDLAGEVWVAVAKSIERFDGDWDDFRKWFFAIARRRAADHHRRTRTRRTILETNAIDDRWTSTVRSSEEQAIDRVRGGDVATIIASVLTEDQAEVVLLRVLGDLDADQVAAIMDRSPGWVRVTQHRALRRLATHFSDRATTVPS